jgi:hypothetical protein
MKDFLMGTLAAVVFAAVIVWAILHATSAEAWHAGEHTSGCDGTDACGCYERLIGGEADK